MTPFRENTWQAGAQGCAFDKDNTLTLPFLKTVYPDIQASLDECREVFDGKIVLFSNSAGLKQFDPDGALHLGLEGLLYYDCYVVRGIGSLPAACF